MVESHKSFGERIRAVRKKAELSREFVAEKVGIGSNYFGQIERGEKWPALELIVKIAGTLSVSPATFFEFEAAENDPKVLNEKISALLANRDLEELREVFRLLKSLLGG